MDCLIIAAGHGSRLRSLAPSKPLAPVAGVPLIEHVVRRTAQGGATRFVVVTGYAGEAVEAFLKTLAPRAGVVVDTVRVDDWDLPNGHSVLAAEALLGEAPYLLVMADHLVDPGIVSAMIARHARVDGVALAVDRRLDNPAVDLDDVTRVATDGDRIVALGKGLATYDSFDTGVFIASSRLRAALCAVAASGAPCSLSAGVGALAKEGRAHALTIGDRWWCDVDDPAAHRLCEAMLAEQAAA